MKMPPLKAVPREDASKNPPPKKSPRPEEPSMKMRPLKTLPRQDVSRDPLTSPSMSKRRRELVDDEVEHEHERQRHLQRKYALGNRGVFPKDVFLNVDDDTVSTTSQTNVAQTLLGMGSHTYPRDQVHDPGASQDTTASQDTSKDSAGVPVAASVRINESQESTASQDTIQNTAGRPVAALERIDASQDATAAQRTSKDIAGSPVAALDRINASAVPRLQMSENTIASFATTDTEGSVNETSHGVEVPTGDPPARNPIDPEQVPIRYHNTRNFDRNTTERDKSKIYIVKYGVVYFAVTEKKQGERLLASLARLFVRPDPVDNPPHKCIRCSKRFQTFPDFLLHWEFRCMFEPGGDVDDRKSYIMYPAHFVSFLAVDMLDNTVFPGVLDLIDRDALPFRFGAHNVRHFHDIADESRRERQLVEPAKKTKRTFQYYVMMKYDYMSDVTRHWPPFLWFLTFIKHPIDWPLNARFMLQPPRRKRTHE